MIRCLEQLLDHYRNLTPAGQLPVLSRRRIRCVNAGEEWEGLSGWRWGECLERKGVECSGDLMDRAGLVATGVPGLEMDLWRRVPCWKARFIL